MYDAVLNQAPWLSAMIDTLARQGWRGWTLLLPQVLITSALDLRKEIEC